MASVSGNGDIDDFEGLRQKSASFSYRVCYNGEDYAVSFTT